MSFTELQIRSLKFTSFDASCVISSQNPMFDHMLESSRWDDSNKWSKSRWDDSNKWSNFEFGEDKYVRYRNKNRHLFWSPSFITGPTSMSVQEELWNCTVLLLLCYKCYLYIIIYIVVDLFVVVHLGFFLTKKEHIEISQQGWAVAQW